MPDQEFSVRIEAGEVMLDGDLVLPDAPRGVVVFAHGSGSGRQSPRNRYVADVLNKANLATLLMDLLTQQEERIDDRNAALRFDIGLLGRRLVQATRWVLQLEQTRLLPVGYFGASTGAAAALVAAAELSGFIDAVVSRGGRPDLAGQALRQVIAPTLLIVGGNDPQVLELNRRAMALLAGYKELIVVPGASHLFEEPGALESVADIAKNWFVRYLGRTREEKKAS
jgi:putative phosphoribosyl transferase